MNGPPMPERDLAWRLANVEDRLDAISERLGRIESSLRGAVAEEVQGATVDLRRALSELGRRLVQDLPHELARHRDAIVAELRAPEPAPEPPAGPTDAQAGATAGAYPGPAYVDYGGGDTDSDRDEPDEPAAEGDGGDREAGAPGSRRRQASPPGRRARLRRRPG